MSLDHPRSGGGLLHSFGGLGRLCCVCLSPDARYVAVGVAPSSYRDPEPEGTATIRCYDVSTGLEALAGITEGMLDLFVQAVAFSSDGRRLVCACHRMEKATNSRGTVYYNEVDFKIKIWSLPDNPVAASTSTLSLMVTVDLKPVGLSGVALTDMVLAVRTSSDVSLWDISQGVENVRS